MTPETFSQMLDDHKAGVDNAKTARIRELEGMIQRALAELDRANVYRFALQEGQEGYGIPESCVEAAIKELREK